MIFDKLKKKDPVAFKAIVDKIEEIVNKESIKGGGWGTAGLED